MKRIKSTPLSLLIACTFLLLLSCSSDDDIGNNALSENLSEANTQAQLDQINEGVNDIIEQVYYQYYTNNSNKKESDKAFQKNDFFTDCVNVDAQMHKDQNLTVMVNFGEGCLTKKNNFISGQLIIEYKAINNQITATHRYQDFFFNEHQIEGEAQVSRFNFKQEYGPINRTTIERNLNITFNGVKKINLVESRIRTCVEGIETSNWQDNVYEITGERTINYGAGLSKKLTISQPLLRDMNCKIFTAGVLNIKDSRKEFSIDYGDGSCDNLFTVHIAQQAHEIKF